MSAVGRGAVSRFGRGEGRGADAGRLVSCGAELFAGAADLDRRDASRSVELSVPFFVLHIFRMTVFFVLAGFFARLLLERRASAASSPTG